MARRVSITRPVGDQSLFATPLTWRILDGLVAVMMIGLGIWMAVS